MRVLFLGTPEFAAVSLRALLDSSRPAGAGGDCVAATATANKTNAASAPNSAISYDVCGVFTQPDRPAGRGQRLTASPVKTLAEAYGIPVWQPQRLRDATNQAVVEHLRPDVIVTAAYGQLVPSWMLRLSRLYPVNVHASLLPRWRGASPIAHTLLNGDRESGVTTIVMDEALDAGGILLQESLPVPPNATTAELTLTLAQLGASLLLRTLSGLADGTLRPIPQNERQVTWAPRITKAETPLDLTQTASAIHNRVRALNPWPGASCAFRGEKVTLWRSQPVENSAATPRPGEILGITGDALRIGCGSHTALDILEIQRPGKKRLNGREFAAGARLKAGDFLVI